MASSVMLEKQQPGAFILSEGAGVISRDTVTLKAGQNLTAGTLLGKLTATGKAVAYNASAIDGSEVVVGILYITTNAITDTPAVAIVRLSEVDETALTGLDEAGKQALAKLNIITR